MISSIQGGTSQSILNRATPAARAGAGTATGSSAAAGTERADGMLPAVAAQPVPNNAAPRDKDGRPIADVVIFGASGDLTRRLLVPELYELWVNGNLSPLSTITGAAPDDFTVEQFQQRMADGLTEFAEANPLDPGFVQFIGQIRYERVPFDVEAMRAFKTRLDAFDGERGIQGKRLIHGAIPPAVLMLELQVLRDSGFLQSAPGAPTTTLIIEKPIGADSATFAEIDRLVREVAPESQVVRVDHFLGKTGAMLIEVLRFGGRPLESSLETMWNNRFVKNVVIRAEETVNVGTRGSFYERTGALKDMIQSHLLQLLALVGIERPTELEGEPVRDAKIALLNAVRVPSPEEAAANVVRGQYTSGTVLGVEIPAYRAIANVNPESEVETLAAVRVFVDNERWQGVPFHMVSGKALEEKVTDISLEFGSISVELAEALSAQRPDLADALRDYENIPAKLTIRIDPEPGVVIELLGQEIQLLGDLGGIEDMGPYARMLLMAIVGNSEYAVHSLEAQRMWAVSDAFSATFVDSDAVPLHMYPAGSQGPIEVHELLAGRAETAPRSSGPSVGWSAQESAPAM